MQAFRATATVNEDKELRIAHLPFPPGAELEIIVLDKEAQGTEGGKKGPERHPDARRLAQDQYRLAEQYPGEYVLMVGTTTVHHSSDRQEVLAAFRQAWTDFPSERPVVVAPSGKPKQKPLFRGRSLTAKLDT